MISCSQRNAKACRFDLKHRELRIRKSEQLQQYIKYVGTTKHKAKQHGDIYRVGIIEVESKKSCVLVWNHGSCMKKVVPRCNAKNIVPSRPSCGNKKIEKATSFL